MDIDDALLADAVRLCALVTSPAYESEAEAARLGPIVDAARARYRELSRARSNADAGLAARVEALRALLAGASRPAGSDPALPATYVLGFLFSPDARRVALVRKRRPAWQRGRLNGPGGKVEPGETSLEAVVREVAEETGVRVEAAAWRHRARLWWNGPHAGSLDVFAAFDARIDLVRTVESEKVGIHRVRPLPRSVINNLHWLVPLCLDNVDGPVVVRDLGGAESGIVNRLELLRRAA